jgi:hypothetical protein
MDWLDRAYDAHDVHLLLLPVDPKWDALRGDTRFLALLERCGFDCGGTPLAGKGKSAIDRASRRS